MKKTFFANLLFVVLLNIIIKPLWVLGVDRSVQNHVDYKAYGLYFALFNFSFIFNIITDMGLTYYNNRHIAQNPTLSRTYFTHIVLMKLLLAFVYLIITIVTALFWYDSYSIKLLIVLCLSQVMLSLILYFRSNISALHFFRLDSLLSVTDRTLMIIFFGAFILTPSLKDHLTIEWFIIGQAICYGLTLCIAIIANVVLIRSFSFHLSRKTFAEIWRSSYDYVPVIFFMATYSKIDGVLVEKLVSSHEAGIYASAYRLLDASTQFGYLFAVLLLPIFSRMIARRSSIESLLSSSFTMIFLFAGSIIMCCVFYGNGIMHALYPHANAYSGLLLSVVMTTLLGSSSVFIFGTLLSANASMKHLKIITGIAAVLNIVMNLILIPKYGAAGAALTASGTNLFVAITEMLIVKKLFNLRINIILIGRLALFVLFSLAGTWLIKHFADIKWTLQTLASLFLYIILAILLKLFDYKEILRFKELAEV